GFFEYLSINSSSIVAITAYTRTNAARLIAIQVVDSDGEMPFLVSMIPCTIHGCRPDSVSSHPAVFIKNGSTTAQVATSRNTREVASFLRRISHSPQAPMRKTTTAR